MSLNIRQVRDKFGEIAEWYQNTPSVNAVGNSVGIYVGVRALGAVASVVLRNPEFQFIADMAAPVISCAYASARADSIDTTTLKDSAKVGLGGLCGGLLFHTAGVDRFTPLGSELSDAIRTVRFGIEPLIPYDVSNFTVGATAGLIVGTAVQISKYKARQQQNVQNPPANP